MDGIHRFSRQVIDLAERLEDVADAAQGKGVRGSGMPTRWLILPAAGAGLYALATNNSFGRGARRVMGEAKNRAAELPEDLLNRVRQTSGAQAGRTTGQGGANGAQRRKSSGRSRTSSRSRSRSSSKARSAR
jgi:hypothetical protein